MKPGTLKDLCSCANWAKYVDPTGLNDAEKASLQHQIDLAHFVSRFAPEINDWTTSCGISLTDMGKQTVYQQSLIEDTAFSNNLFSMLKLEDKQRPEVQILSKITDGKPLFNPSLDNKTIRQAFAAENLLFSFLHELPGIAEALQLFYNDESQVTAKLFQEIVSIALFHNGPMAGFWGIFTKSMEEKISALPENLSSLFASSIYDGTEGKLVYPKPKSFSGNVHLLADRLSQGSQGGIRKIWYEIASMELVSRIEGATLYNTSWTLAQLEDLGDFRHVTDPFRNYDLETTRSRLMAIRDEVVKEMTTLHTFFHRQIVISKEGEKTVTLTNREGDSLVVKSDSGPENARQFLWEILQQIEDPMSKSRFESSL